MTLSTRQIRLIAAFAGLNVVLVVAGWVGLVSPQRHDASTFSANAATAQAQLAQLLHGGGSQQPTKQPAIHTSCLYKLDTALPSQADQPNLLLELDRLATASGVRVLGVSPQAAQALPAGYTVLPINLNLDGTYFHLTAFFHTLRTLVAEHHGCPTANGPLFGVTSIALTPKPGGDTPATVQMQAFYYGVAAGAAPPTPPATTDTTTTTGG